LEGGISRLSFVALLQIIPGMPSFLQRWLNFSPAHPAPRAPVASARGAGHDVSPFEDTGDYAITRYPPFDQGIPVIPLEKLLYSQRDLIGRLFRTAGVSHADFERLYLTAVRNLAAHVHLLPATGTSYFRGTGGLFRMSLEIALNSLQSANAAVFPTGGVERRYFMQPKWTLASFLAGLCSQCYRMVNSMAVLTRDNEQWPPLLGPLAAWCAERGAKVYFVRWLEDVPVRGAQAVSTYAIAQVVPLKVLQYLANDNNHVVPAMTAAIAGVETSMSENPIGRLVAPVVTRVIEDDMKRSATHYGHLVIGAHLEMHLLDAMRRLVKGGQWIANNMASGGRLWVGREGVFIDWPPASKDIAKLLARDSFAGIPQDPDTLADLLVSARLLQKDVRGGRYWTITLPGSFEVKEGMVRLREGQILFPQGFDFEPYRHIRLTLPALVEQGGGAKSTDAPGGVSAAAPGPPAAPFCQEMPADVPVGTQGRFFVAESEVPPVEPPGRRKKSVSAADEPFRSRRRPATVPDDPASPSEGDLKAPNQKQAAESPANSLLGSLKEENARLLGEVLRACREHTLDGGVASLPQGFGISHDELARHGVPVMDLIEELAGKSWLWRDKTRPTRNIHPIEIAGKTVRMVILKTEIAAGLGFNIAKE
jgi:hypothetical protein